VAARVAGSASFVAARRLNRLLEPFTNSSSAARSVTRSSEAMIFSERARVSVFATVAFEVCFALAIFVLHFLSANATGRGPAVPTNSLCETLLLFVRRRYFPFDGAGARVALAVAAAFFWLLSCVSCFLALSFDFGDLSPMENTSACWSGLPRANWLGYHRRDRALMNVARFKGTGAGRTSRT